MDEEAHWHMRASILAVCAFTLLLFQTSLAYEIGQIQDSDGQVNVRALPLLKGGNFTTIPDGNQVLIWRSEGDFHLVITPEMRQQGQIYRPLAGWVHKSRVKSLGQQAKAIIMTADADSATNLRAGPSTSTRILAKVTPKQVLMVLEKGDWLKVRAASGQTGYIHSSVASQPISLMPDRALTKKVCQTLFTPLEGAVGGDYSVYNMCGRQIILNKDGSFFKVQFQPKAGPLIGGFANGWVLILASRSHRPDGGTDLPGQDQLLKRQASGRYKRVAHGFDFLPEELDRLGVPLSVRRSLGL